MNLMSHIEQAEQQAELQKRLWAVANDLRGNMDASEYRNYILGLIFYRFLSEKVENYANELLQDDDVDFADAEQDADLMQDLKDEVIDVLGFFIEPRYLFMTMVKKINAGDFDVEMLQNAINEVQNSTLGKESENDFKGLFEDLDLQSSRLGNTVAKRSKLIAKVILSLSNIDFGEQDIKIDILGDAYEYLIGQFAASAGKKAGEFYTPQQVSKLLQLGNYATIGNYYGQEINGTTYNLARMNLLMHEVSYNRFDLRQGDTLEEDHFDDLTFDAVVANPPYSAKWNPDDKLDDERFRKYGKTAPKSKADFAFVEHMLYHLNNEGTMAVVLPHGVLFRGAAEGKIRQYMIEHDNVLDAVIGLPANLFYGTSIPTVVLVFKKGRERQDIFFIDASNDFEKGKNQNNLTDENVDKILETIEKREDVDKYAHRAEVAEIVENEYNLNIPRYVDTFEEEPPVDVDKLVKEMGEADAKINDLQSELSGMMADLVATDPVAQQQLEAIRRMLQ